MGDRSKGIGSEGSSATVKWKIKTFTIDPVEGESSHLETASGTRGIHRGRKLRAWELRKLQEKQKEGRTDRRKNAKGGKAKLAVKHAWRKGHQELSITFVANSGRGPVPQQEK